QSGRVVLPGGMSYGMLVLAGGDHMTLAAARQVRSLVQQGATVLATKKPLGSRSLADGPAGDEEVRKIADELWGPGEPGAQGEHASGKGRVIWGRDPAAVLAELGQPKDFEAASGDTANDILFAHRRAGSEDIYFIANHLNHPAKFSGMFRQQGLNP